MLIAGIIGNSNKTQTASLINSLLTSKGKKVSIIDSRNLSDLGAAQVKSYLNELGRNNVDVLMLKINLPDMKREIFKDIHFDIMVYTDKGEGQSLQDAKDYESLMRDIFSLLDEKGVIIANVDDGELLAFLQGRKQHIVTYGFNSKASVTTSSIGDTVAEDGLMCCLQQTIAFKDGVLVGPQEYRIQVENTGFDAHNALAAATFAIVNGVDLN